MTLRVSIFMFNYVSGPGLMFFGYVYICNACKLRPVLYLLSNGKPY